MASFLIDTRDSALESAHAIHDGESRSCHQSGCGDGDDPGPHDAASDSPTNGGQAVNGADSYDGPRDGVGGADGNAREGGGKQSDGAGGFGAKPANGFELGDSLPHGFYDAPTAEVGSGGDGGMGGKNDGPMQATPASQHVGLAHESPGVEGTGDDPHGLLGVVGAMTQTIGSGGEQLQPAEQPVDRLRRRSGRRFGDFIHDQPVGCGIGEVEDIIERG